MPKYWLAGFTAGREFHPALKYYVVIIHNTCYFVNNKIHFHDKLKSKESYPLNIELFKRNVYFQEGALDESSCIMMRRYTKKHGDVYNIDISEIQLSQTVVSGNAIDRLAKFENFYEDLINEQARISIHLNQLRESKKTKSVTFRQLFANKLNIDMMIERVHRFTDNKKD